MLCENADMVKHSTFRVKSLQSYLKIVFSFACLCVCVCVCVHVRVRACVCVPTVFHHKRTEKWNNHAIKPLMKDLYTDGLVAHSRFCCSINYKTNKQPKQNKKQGGGGGWGKNHTNFYSRYTASAGPGVGAGSSAVEDSWMFSG